MSVPESGGESDFEFGREEYYPGHAVARDVVWPLVNYLTKMDWIAESVPGDTPEFPFVTDVRDAGHKYMVEVSPICAETPTYLNEGECEDYRRDHFVDIIVDQEFPRPMGDEDGSARALLLKNAKIQSFRQYERFDALDEDGDLVWPSGEDSDIVVVSQQASIYTPEGLHHQSATLVLNGSQETVYKPLAIGGGDYDPATDQEGIFADNPHFVSLTNIVSLELACKAFLTPPFTPDALNVQNALSRIRENPAEVY